MSYWIKAQVKLPPAVVLLLTVIGAGLLSASRLELPFSNMFEVAGSVFLSVVPALVLLKVLRPEQGHVAALSPRPYPLLHVVAWVLYGGSHMVLTLATSLVVGELAVGVAFVRNVGLLVTLAVVSAALFGFDWAWVPMVVYFLACCLMGLDERNEPHWWAVLLMEGGRSGGVALLVLVAFMGSLILYCARARTTAVAESSAS